MTYQICHAAVQSDLSHLHEVSDRSKQVLPVMPRRVAAGGRAGPASPSGSGGAMPCSSCPWCSPLPRRLLPVGVPSPRPCLRTHPPCWTGWGATETGARCQGDWKTAVRLNLAEIRNYASGCGPSARCPSAQSKAWSSPCLLTCTRQVWTGPGWGSSGLLQSAWCWRWPWWGSAVSLPGFSQFSGRFHGSCRQSRSWGHCPPSPGWPRGPSRRRWLWKSCWSPARLCCVHPCSRHRCPRRCRRNLERGERASVGLSDHLSNVQGTCCNVQEHTGVQWHAISQLSN